MEFILPIIPKAQMRARHSTSNGFVQTHKHPQQKIEENNLCALLLPHRPTQPLEGPLELNVVAYLPVPMSWSGKRISQAERGLIRPTCKPDLDNLVKHLKDCLTTACFWHDDKQVVSLIANKLYNDGHGPRWQVEIVPIGAIAERLK